MKLFDAAKSVDIKEIYKKYVGELGRFKKGKASIAVKCPFHDDKTPSLNLFPNNTYYCFGCEEYGTNIDFVMKMKNVDNATAAKIICEDFGIQYEDTLATRTEGGHKSPAALTQDANELLALNEQLTQVFCSYLPTAPNPKYFDDRGVGALKTSHRLGYCPSKPIFKDIPKGQEHALCDEKGVCVFHDRYIVPIVSFSEKVIGFIGRATPELEATGAPKYLITANNVIFQKRRVFYNPNGLKTEESGVFVVEGVFDALALIAAGVENVVCPFGNSLSDQHLDVFRKFGKAINCAFDADVPGKEATWKLMRYARGIKVNIPVGDMLGCKDYGEIIEKYGEENVAKACSELKTAPDFLLDGMKEKGMFKTEDGQDAAWENLAKVIGSANPAFREKYPYNLGYTPVAFKRYWKKFSDLVGVEKDS